MRMEKTETEKQALDEKYIKENIAPLLDKLKTLADVEKIDIDEAKNLKEEIRNKIKNLTTKKFQDEIEQEMMGHFKKIMERTQNVVEGEEEAEIEVEKLKKSP
jgi:hypothetical protein